MTVELAKPATWRNVALRTSMQRLSKGSGIGRGGLDRVIRGAVKNQFYT